MVKALGYDPLYAVYGSLELSVATNVLGHRFEPRGVVTVDGRIIEHKAITCGEGKLYVEGIVFCFLLLCWR